MLKTNNDAVKEIKSNISPAEAIERYTGQQDRHKKYLCPFHSDKHPSLSVKGEHWRCWSCGAKGDVIDFTSRYFGIGFKEAMNKLSEDFGINIKRFNDPILNPLEKLGKLIEIESREYNREQIAIYREQINAKIDALTAAHRALVHQRAPERLLREYADEIDELMRIESIL